MVDCTIPGMGIGLPMIWGGVYPRWLELGNEKGVAYLGIFDKLEKIPILEYTTHVLSRLSLRL